MRARLLYLGLHGWPKGLLGKLGATRRARPGAKQSIKTGHYRVTWRNPPQQYHRSKIGDWRVTVTQERTGDSWIIEGEHAKKLVYELKDIFAQRQDDANERITATVMRHGR